MTRTDISFIINALLIFILCGVLLSAYYVQFVFKEQPCPLCMLQRLAMIGVATGAFLNLRFGMQPQHYGIALLSALVGSLVALRHILLHICAESPLPDHLPILGFHLYTWSFIVFTCAMITITLSLFLYKPSAETASKSKPFSILASMAFIIILLVAAANAVTTFIQCGWGPCAD